MKKKEDKSLQVIESAVKLNGKPLDIKEKNFIIEYLSDPHYSAERAAIRAGYSESTARKKASIWVGNSRQNQKPYLKETIDIIVDNKIKRSGKTIYKIMQEIENIAFCNIADFFPIMGEDGISLDEFKKLPRSITSSIESIQQTTDSNGNVNVKLKFYSKTKALDQLARHTFTMSKDPAFKNRRREIAVFIMPTSDPPVSDERFEEILRDQITKELKNGWTPGGIM